MIIAQYGEGSQHETHSEKSTRKIKEWEAKWQAMQEQFRQVKPGPNLVDDYLKMKREVVGAECKKIAFESQIIEVDAAQPRTIAKTADDRFSFGLFTACVELHGVLYAFKTQAETMKTTVTKIENATSKDRVLIRNLSPLPQYRRSFAICIIKDRYVLLTGGDNENLNTRTEVFLFDTETEVWVHSPQ